MIKSQFTNAQIFINSANASTVKVEEVDCSIAVLKSLLKALNLVSVNVYCSWVGEKGIEEVFVMTDEEFTKLRLEETK